MGLGYLKSPRHAAKDRRIIRRLARHAELMAAKETEGFSRKDASSIAARQIEEEERTARLGPSMIIFD